MELQSAAQVWETALGELQVLLPRPSYDTWLKDTRGLALSAGCLTVGAPSIFAAEWLRHRLAPLIKRTVTKVAGEDVDVSFAVVDATMAASATPALMSQGDDESARIGSYQQPSRARSMLNPRYTCASFIVGGANRFAHAAAVAVAENPGHAYNPLFFYSPAGLGKTHLLHAIGHQCLRGNLDVLYITSEQFTNEFIHALRERRTEDFRAKYRNVDVLLIDDIHFIADKEQTQESFFHTFNDLHTASKQIVISSDRSPSFMPLLEDRLRSRFEWGLIADIQPPDLETRLAILQSRAEEMEIPVPHEVLEVVAHRFPSNIRQLEGAFNRVIAYCRMARSSPTVELAQTAISELLHQPRHWSPNPTRIIEIVAHHYQTPPTDLVGPRRSRDLAFARQVAMYLLRHETSLSLSDIGKALGNRDHSTILHGCEKIAQLAGHDLPIQRTLADLSATIRSQRAE